MPNYINKVIGGYKIEKFIAKGGMGSVYLAKHPILTGKPPVAIKVLHSHLIETGNLKERFRREANLQARLKHSSLIQLHEYIEDQNDCYILMEYFDSISLSDIIGKKTGPMPFKRAIPIFKQILEGVQYAHDNGIIHRDIKPSNILISKDDVVKITDFGIAKAVDDNSMTATGSVIGTKLYMSPEQVQGNRATKKSDIYSLGVTFYEMLAGRVPFDSDNEFTVMQGHINQRPDPPTKYYPHIPEYLVDSVMKAMEKKPGSRFNDCNQFFQAISGELKVPSAKPSVKKSTSNKKKSTRKKKETNSTETSWMNVLIYSAIAIFIFFLVIPSNVAPPTPEKDKNQSTKTKPSKTQPTKTPTKKSLSAVQLYNKGMIEYNKEDFERAISFFDEALKKNSNYENARFYRAWSFLRLKNYNKAERDAQALIKKRNSAEDYDLRGMIRFYTKKYTAAISDWDTAISLDRTKYIYLYMRGFSKYRINKLSGAKSDAVKLLQAGDKRGYHLRGLVYYQEKKTSKACSDLEKAKVLGGVVEEDYYELCR